jgi:hypothetical protein
MPVFSILFTISIREGGFFLAAFLTEEALADTGPAVAVNESAPVE